jgi:hypothetical protein
MRRNFFQVTNDSYWNWGTSGAANIDVRRKRKIMKIVVILAMALVAVGCENSQQKYSAPLTKANPLLTEDQASILAMRLADDSVDRLNHWRPFSMGQPHYDRISFKDGRWIWTSDLGHGLMSWGVRVEIAPDGSTSSFSEWSM